MDKMTLRGEVAALRRARSGTEISQARTAVRRHVLAHVDSARPECVAAYEPLRTEPGSTELLAGLHERGVRVLVPLTLPDRDLDWVDWAPEGTGRPLGAAAIAMAELMLVPALAVGADGTRLGRGGGSYDRALTRVATGTQVAVLLFDGEIRDSIPADPWDLPVGWAVMPSGWLGVGRNTATAPDA